MWAVLVRARLDRPHLCRGFGRNGPSESSDKNQRAFFASARIYDQIASMPLLNLFARLVKP